MKTKNIITFYAVLIAVLLIGYAMTKTNYQKQSAESMVKSKALLDKYQVESFKDRLDSLKREQAKRCETRVNEEYVHTMKKLKQDQAEVENQTKVYKSDTL